MALSLLIVGGTTSIANSGASTGDSGPPVDLTSLVPGDHRNTIHREQPLVARFSEAGRHSVNEGSISFHLTDEDTGTVTAFDDEKVTYDALTGIARTRPASLIPEHRYRVVLTASDEQGNERVVTWTFRSMTIDVTKATATIGATEGTKSAESEQSGDNAAWKFSPRLDMSRFRVTASPTAHSGYGPIGHVVPLATTRIEYGLPGLPEGTRLSVPAYAPTKSVTAYRQYVQFLTDTDRTTTLQTYSAHLEPLTVSLPGAAINPVLTLDPVLASPSIPAADCPDPFVGAAGCDPDPLRFFMAEDFALSMFEKQQYGESLAPEAVPDLGVGLAKYICGTVDPATGRCTVPIPHWLPLDPDTRVPVVTPAPPVMPAVFATPGTYRWVVPVDVHAVETVVRGGVGGGLPGFFGAATTQQATLSVTPGQVLDIVVAGAGRDTVGGYGGGGNGGNGVVGPCCGGGGNGYGGGGASRITRSGSHLVVGAGGGGMGGGGTLTSTSSGVPSGGATTQGGVGGDGGAPALDGGRGSAVPGTWQGGFGGRGGNASSGGAGGSGTGDPDGAPGGLLVGGRGANASAPGSGGGGGGGGIYGGGGGEAAWYGGLGGGGGGGGGGRSLGGTTVTQTAPTAGDVGLDGFVAIVPKETLTAPSSASALATTPSSSRVDIDGATYFDGVSYSRDVPVPQQFAAACAVGYRCVSNDIAMQPTTVALAGGGGYQNRDLQRKCLFIDGFNRPNADCIQEYGLAVVVPYTMGVNRVMASWVTQLGFADNTTGAPPPDDRVKSPAAVDSFGATFYDDEENGTSPVWQFVNNPAWNKFFVQNDWYYHLGDIPQCHRAFSGCTTPIPPTRDHSKYVNVPELDALVGWSADQRKWGYGFSIPHDGRVNTPLDGLGYPRTSTQYYDACYAEYVRFGNTDCEVGGTSSWFSGYYNPDAGTRVGPRAAMGRTYGYHMDAEFTTLGNDTSRNGYFVTHYGHKWTEYGVRWSPGWGFDFFPNAGPGFGISFEPYEEEKSRVSHDEFRYCFGGAPCDVAE